MKKTMGTFVILLFLIGWMGVPNAKADDVPGNTPFLEKYEERMPSIENRIVSNNLIENRVGVLPRAVSSGGILTFPNIFTVNSSSGVSNGRIPGEYANLLRLTNQSKYKLVGASSHTSSYTRFAYTHTEAADKKPHYVEISHVAVYKGRDIDVRVNIENMKGTSGTSRVDILTPTNVKSNDFLEIQFRGANNELFLRYEFRDHETGQLIPFKGTWIVKRLNNYKTLRLDTSPNHLKSIFAYNNSALQYETSNNFETTVFSSTSASTVANNKLNQLMFSFDASDGILKHTYFPRGSGTRFVYYDHVAIAPFDLPHPNIQGVQNEAYPKVSYKLTQDYPAQNQAEYYPKQYKLTVQLDKILQMDQVNYKITNVNGEDAKNNFIVTQDKENAKMYFEINQATLSNEKFVNNTYTIELESEIDWKIPKEPYVKEDGYFHIPASIQMKSDVNSSPVTEANAKTKYIKGYVNVHYLLDDEKTSLLPSEELVGEIGDPYEFTKKEIPKYEYVRTNGKTSGIFEKEPKMVQFIYKLIPNEAPTIIFDQQSTEAISYDGMDFKLSGQVRDADSRSVKVFYQVDGGAAKLIQNFIQDEEENTPFNYAALVPKELLKDGKPHQITVYAEDDEGMKSQRKTVSLKAFTGELQFVSAPKQVTFGENVYISSKTKIYYVSYKEKDLVVHDTRVEKGGWRMSALLTQPLTSISGDIIEDGLRYNQEIITTGNTITIMEKNMTDDRPINISKDWIEHQEGLNIMIPAGKVRAEQYITEMEWLLEDVPGN